MATTAATRWLWVSAPAATFGVALDTFDVVIGGAEVVTDLGLIGLTREEAHEVLVDELGAATRIVPLP